MNPGQTIGHYQIQERLGEGGMGVVYKALDTRLDRPLAVKFVLKKRVPPERWDNFVQRFDREARALAKLSHPNIVSILDYGEFEGQPFLVMEHMPGGSLAEKTGQPIPWRQALEWVIPLAKALGHAHSKGILHRDIKPQNILFTEDGQPKLADFGLAKAMDSGVKSDLSQSTVGIGTAEYMAPEQALGKTVDGRADQYGLAMVLYELVTGRKPFKGDTALEVLLKQVNETLPQPRTFAPDLPERTERILLKALEKIPDDRYGTMNEFVITLESLARMDESQVPGRTRRGYILAGLAIFVILISTAGILAMYQYRLVDPTSVPILPSPTLQFASTTRSAPPPFTATPENTPTLTSTTWPIGFLIVETAEIRQGPGDSYPVLYTIGKDSIITLLGRIENGSWYYVSVDNQETGWVDAPAVTPSIDTATLPILTAVPTATSTPSVTSTESQATLAPTRTPRPPTKTPRPSAKTPKPPTNTPKPPTNTPVIRPPTPTPS